MVHAFEFFSGKTENFRQKKRYASRLETASVKNVLAENDRVRYGTVLRINSDPLLYIFPIRAKISLKTGLFLFWILKYIMGLNRMAVNLV
jgi:hypothetical protein